MSILQDLLALKRPVEESHRVDPEDVLAGRADELEAMHAAQADEFHGREVDGTYNELAQADEFSVQLDEDDMVHILDGEMAVRVSMPHHTWIELCRQSV